MATTRAGTIGTCVYTADPEGWSVQIGEPPPPPLQVTEAWFDRFLDKKGEAVTVVTDDATPDGPALTSVTFH